MSKETKKRIYLIVAVVVIISIVLEAIFAHPHGHEIWHVVPGFDALIAFFGGWILILFAKKVLAPALQRDEDYYDRKNGGDKE